MKTFREILEQAERAYDSAAADSGDDHCMREHLRAALMAIRGNLVAVFDTGDASGEPEPAADMPEPSEPKPDFRTVELELDEEDQKNVDALMATGKWESFDALITSGIGLMVRDALVERLIRAGRKLAASLTEAQAVAAIRIADDDAMMAYMLGCYHGKLGKP